jgi:hypothetical protein
MKRKPALRALLLIGVVAMALLPRPAAAVQGVHDIWWPAYGTGGHGVNQFDYVRGSHARVEMHVKDYSADGYCVELWYDWRFNPFIHDDPTGVRVCGVGNSARAFTGETDPTKIARLDGIRSAVCLWRSAQGGRASCSASWAYNIVVDPINV